MDGFCHWLLSGGFSHGCIRNHLANVSHLNEHLRAGRHPTRERLSARDVADFHRAYSLRCQQRGLCEEHVRRVGYSVHWFTDYLGQQGCFDAQVSSPIYQPVLDAYLGWMRHHQHASQGTLKLRAHSIRQFLDWLGAEAAAPRLAALSAEIVEGFFVAYGQKVGRSAQRSMQSALRTFLRLTPEVGQSLLDYLRNGRPARICHPHGPAGTLPEGGGRPARPSSSGHNIFV
jgi:hypothetical protein